MSKRIFTVLTIDGGGVRGIISARLLQEVEKRTDKPIAELYDLVAGVSTGAILAGSLTAPSAEDPTKPRFSAKDMVDFYLSYAKEIFPEDRFRMWKHFIPGMTGTFDDAPFERILENHLSDLKLRDSITHLMMAGADMKKFTPVWMSHFREQEKNSKLTKKWHNLAVRDAIRASASAPMVFPSKYIYTQPNENMTESSERHAFLDGSLFAANIARSAYTKARQICEDGETPRIILTSVGTGHVKRSLTPNEMNRGSLNWILSLWTASTELTQKDSLNDLAEEIHEDLHRLDVAIDAEDQDAPTLDLVDSRDTNMAKLLRIAERLIKEKDSEIDIICEKLLARHAQNREYDNSRAALEKISNLIDQTDSIKMLNNLYSKIIHYTADIKHDQPKEKDRELFENSRMLKKSHIRDLKALYELRHSEISDQPKKSKCRTFFNRCAKAMGYKYTPPVPKSDNSPRSKGPGPA